MSGSPARAIARNTSLQTGGHLLGLALTVATAALLTRYLGVSAYGTFSLLAVLLTLPVTVLNGSLDTLAVRRLSVDSDASAFFRNLLALKVAVAGAFAAAATGVAFAAPLPGALRLAVVCFGAAVVASGIQGTLLAAEQARLRFGLPVLVDVGGRLFTLLGIALLVLAPHPGDGHLRVALAIIASAAATLLWLTFTIARRRRQVPLRLAGDRAAWAGIVRAGGPLALISLLGLVNYRLDVVVLGALSGTHDVGIYAVAARFLDAALPLAAFFVAAAFPVLSASASLALEQRQGQARRAAEFLMLASVPIMLGGFVFAPQLVGLVAGAAYADAVTPLRVLVVSVPFSFLSTFLLYLLIAADRQRRVLPLLGASIGLNLVLNVALVPRYGAVAAAVATLASELVGAVALVVVVRRTLGVRVLPASLLRTLAAGAAMVAAALLLEPVHALLAACVSVLVYGAATLSLRVVRPLDVKLLLGRAT